MSDFEREQRNVCKRYGATFTPLDPESKVGIALNVKANVLPLNGLRHPQEGDTSGWYLWAGEDLSDDPDFFKPLHASHIVRWNERLLPYLGLPPGWRFLIADGYEDVWFDESLLSVDE